MTVKGGSKSSLQQLNLQRVYFLPHISVLVKNHLQAINTARRRNIKIFFR